MDDGRDSSEVSGGEEDVDATLRGLRQLEQGVQNLVEDQAKQRSMNLAMKVFKSVTLSNPSIFTGKGDRVPFVLEDWIRHFDKLFQLIRCPETLMVDNAVLYLREYADLWWADKERTMKDKSNVGWIEFKEALRAHFCPSYLKFRLVQEFMVLQQDSMTVGQYYCKFMELMRFAHNIVPSEGLKASQFQQGLNLGIQLKLAVEMETLDSLESVLQKAKYWEAILSQSEGNSDGGGNPNYNNNQQIYGDNGHQNMHSITSS